MVAAIAAVAACHAHGPRLAVATRVLRRHAVVAVPLLPRPPPLDLLLDLLLLLLLLTVLLTLCLQPTGCVTK